MSSEPARGRPVVRVLHQMARSGGTVICRCLASMRGVVLLSEIHPRGLRVFDPLGQAHEWYGLLNEQDIRAARAGRLGFRDAIALVHRRCVERGLVLVIRDWSHLDYTGVPFMQPVYRSLLAESLAPAFELHRFTTVRHPLDQWLSLIGNAVYHEKLAPERFLDGYARFAEMAGSTGFIRFEDFTVDPGEALQAICRALDLTFDPDYRHRWPGYTNITGDVLPGRAPTAQIVRLERQQHDAAEFDRLRAHLRYPEILAALGYVA